MFELRIRNTVVTAKSAAEIQSLVDSGEANSETPIRKIGTEKWNRLSKVRGVKFPESGSPVPPPLQENKSRRPNNVRPAPPIPITSSITSCTQTGEGAFNVRGDYSELLDLVANAMVQNGGKIVRSSADEGIVEGKWKYGLNLLGLRVTAYFRALQTGEIQIAIRGGFADAVDTLGHARAKAIEVAGVFLAMMPIHVVSQQPSPPMAPPPHGTHGGFAQPSFHNSPMMSNTAIPHQGKQKSVAIILCLFGGGLGAHKFYCGGFGWGLLYLLFCWTFIPVIISLVDLIVLAVMSQHDFDVKYNYTPAHAFKW